MMINDKNRHLIDTHTLNLLEKMLAFDHVILSKLGIENYGI